MDPLCDCCCREKPDASPRPGLYPTDAHGKRTERAFKGFICDDCLARARQPGSAENRWLLKQHRVSRLRWSRLGDMSAGERSETRPASSVFLRVSQVHDKGLNPT